MGLRRDEYLDLTPFEFRAIYRRYIEKIEKDREAELYQKLLVARLQLFRQLCPPKGKTMKITDLWELPNEVVERKVERAKRDIKAERERMMKRFG
jgi:hypothetical protein